MKPAQGSVSLAFTAHRYPRRWHGGPWQPCAFLRSSGTSKIWARSWLPYCGSPSSSFFIFFLVLLEGSFESLLSDLLGHLSPQPFFCSLLLYIHESSDMSRTRRSFCPTSGATVRIPIPCLRSLSLVIPLGFPGRLLPFGLTAQFYFLTDAIFCLLGWHLWKWSREIRSGLVYQSQLLPLSWGKNTKETVAHKMFKNVFVIVLHTCLLFFLCKS